MNPITDSVSYRAQEAQRRAMLRQAFMQRLEQSKEQQSRSALQQMVAPIVGGLGNVFLGGMTGLGQLSGTALESLPFTKGIGTNIRERSTAGRRELEADIAGSPFSTIPRNGENSFLVNTASGLGSLAGSMGMGYATGSGSLPALVFGASAGGEQAQQAIEANKDPRFALLAGLAGGGLEAGLEKVGVEKFMGAGGGFVPQLMKRSATEGIQEALQSGAQSAVQATYSPVNPGDALKQALTEGAYGAVVGGIGAGGGQAVGSLNENLQNGNIQQATSKVIDQVQNRRALAQQRMQQLLGNQQPQMAMAGAPVIAPQIQQQQSRPTPNLIRSNQAQNDFGGEVNDLFKQYENVIEKMKEQNANMDREIAIDGGKNGVPGSEQSRFLQSVDNKLAVELPAKILKSTDQDAQKIAQMNKLTTQEELDQLFRENPKKLQFQLKNIGYDGVEVDGKQIVLNQPKAKTQTSDIQQVQKSNEKTFPAEARMQALQQQLPQIKEVNNPSIPEGDYRAKLAINNALRKGEYNVGITDLGGNAISQSDIDWQQPVNQMNNRIEEVAANRFRKERDVGRWATKSRVNNYNDARQQYYKNLTSPYYDDYSVPNNRIIRSSWAGTDNPNSIRNKLQKAQSIKNNAKRAYSDMLYTPTYNETRQERLAEAREYVQPEYESELDKTSKQVTKYAEDTIKKRFTNTGIAINARSGFGAYRGVIEPNIDTTAVVPKGKEGKFYYELAELGDKEFQQSSIITYRTPRSQQRVGWLDKANGISEEPMVRIKLNNQLRAVETEEFNERLNRIGLPGASIKQDGKVVDIINLSHYNENYENFTEQVADLLEELEQDGNLESYSLTTAEVRHIGKTAEDAPVTYQQLRDNLYKEQAKLDPNTPREVTTANNTLKVEELLPRKDYVTRQELEQLSKRPELPALEKQSLQEFIDSYKWQNQPSLFLGSQLKPNTVARPLVISKLKEGLLQVTPERSDRWSNYGMDNLDLGAGDSESVVLNTELEHGHSGHFGTGKDFGHFRYFSSEEGSFIDGDNEHSNYDVKPYGYVPLATFKRALNVEQRKSSGATKQQLEAKALEELRKELNFYSITENSNMVTRREAEQVKKIIEATKNGKDMNDAIEKAKKINTEAFIVEIQSDAYQNNKISEMAPETELEQKGRELDYKRDKAVVQKRIDDTREAIQEAKKVPTYKSIQDIKGEKAKKQALTRINKIFPGLLDTQRVDKRDGVVNRYDSQNTIKSPYWKWSNDSIIEWKFSPITYNLIEQDDKNLADMIKKAGFVPAELKERLDKSLQEYTSRDMLLDSSIATYREGQKKRGEALASPLGKQMLSYGTSNKYRQRLVEEALQDMHEQGFDYAYVPMPSTVAKLEWGANEGEGGVPYTIDGEYVNNEHDDVEVGDTVGYDEDYIVVSSDRYSFEAVPERKVREIDTDEWRQEEVDAKLGDAEYEIERDLDEDIWSDNRPLTPARATALLNESNNFDYSTIKFLELITEETEDYTLARTGYAGDRVYDNLRDYYYEDESNYDLSDIYGQAWYSEDGQTAWVPVDGDRVEVMTWNQPSEYDASAEDYDTIDSSPERGRAVVGEHNFGVLGLYYELPDILRKIQSKNGTSVEPVYGIADGNWWRVGLGKPIKRSAY